jgi:hypothetical protein
LSVSLTYKYYSAFYVILHRNKVNQKQTKQLMKLTTRVDKALQLYQAGAVSKIRDDLYHVKSQKEPTIKYEVILSMNVCTGIDFERTGKPCKHVIAVQIHRTNQIAAVVTAAKISKLNKIGMVAIAK